MIICPNLSNKEVAQEFNELKSALEAADPKHGEAMAYLVWSLNNGNAIDKAPNGAESLLFKSLVDYYEGDRSKAIVAKAKTYSTNFLKWFGDWTKYAQTSDSSKVEEQLALVFERIPELSKMGSIKEYAAYLADVFPNSVDRNIYWHGTNEDLSGGFKSAKKGKGSGAPETRSRNDFYLAKQAWTVLQYVDGVNRNSVDKNGFAHWNKLWWELKEIMSNGRRENNNWKDMVIGEDTVRQEIPNKKGVFNRNKGGGNGKWLSERKADYGYENKSDKEFFEDILGIRWGKDTFNTWTKRNAETFKALEKTQKGIYPAIINTQNPIREKGQNTYYEEQRGLFTLAEREGNDAILGEQTDNEFGSDVAVVLNASENNVHFLGTKEDIEGFKKWLNENRVSKVVDENGEPKIMYHGTPWGDFEEFNPLSPNTGDRTRPGTIYFSSVKWWAETYMKGKFHKGIESPELYAAYLSIKNPFSFEVLSRVDGTNYLYDILHGEVTEKEYHDIYLMLGEYNFYSYDGTIKDIVKIHKYDVFDAIARYFKKSGNLEKYNKIVNRLIKKGMNDGMMWSEKPFDYEEKRQVYVIRSEQIKHVDNRDGEYTGPNIYHNEGEFDSWNKEQQKYYRWLPGAKQRLASASASNIELIKADIRNEFNGFGFKHFTLSIKKNDYDGWYIRTKNRNDQKDIKDLRKIAKTIGYTESGVHELSGEQAENLMKYLFSEVHGTSEHMNNIVSILKSALKDKNIKIQFVRNTVEDSPAYYNHETGVITININGAFKNSNGYDNIAAQTVLHELIHAVTVETIKHSPELHKELETLFNKVKHSARALYSGLYIYGLADIYEFIAELSNEDFVRMLRGIHTASERKLLISTIIDFMRKVINKILTSINKKWQGTAYADAMELLMKAAFPQDFDIKQHSEPQDEQTLFNAISARQQSAEDEANRIITRMNVLYTQYEKMKDKTPSQQRIANRIFETLNKLKQHRDITAVQIALDLAKLTLGQRNLSSNEPARLDGNGNPIANNVYMYLYDSSLTDFSGVSAQSLVDMYRNSIKFYSDLIDNIPSEHTIDLTNEDKKQIEELSSLIKYSIMPLWTRAIMTVGDRIVEDQIDLEVSSSEENKEDMKKVVKDWLHKNLMYGDINVVTSYIYNNSYSSNPIIKQAFHLIQGAEQKTLEEMHQIAPELIKAYQKANVGLRAVTPGWQSMMMEYDEKGIPTGNFVTEVNFGQYQKDLKEFLGDLNDEFMEDYGFTYVVDDTGAVTNSLTGEFAEDEEWGPDGEPPVYIQYLTRIELWKQDRVHRRYLPDYYMERISRPYDGTIDPLSPEFKDTRFNHGLSPRTLSKYTYYQSNINFYLNKCQDEITGLVYPERLSYDDLLSLDRFKSEMEQFTQLFNPDGSYKTGEDLKMAYEVRAWLKFTGEHNNPTVNQDSFNNELAKVKQESIAKNNPRIYNDFIRYNSHIGINPDYILQTVGDFKLTRLDTDTSFRGRLMRASLQAMVNNPRIFDKELQKMVNNPLFWLLCKMADLAIEDSREPTNPSGWDKEKVEKYNENFYQRDILYIDEYGFYIDRDGNKINPQNPKAKELEESGKLLTFRQWLINKYTDEALRTGAVTGLIDESTGQPIDFGGLSKNEIHHQISILLSFRQKTWDEDGTVSEEYVPLSIFTTLSPTTETFFNSRTKRTEPTVIVVGDNRFKEYNSTLLDTDYNPKSGIAEIPNIKYAGGRYDNIVAYMNVMRDDNVKELYDLLINTMRDALSIYSTNRKFNYKIPQINARTVALFSRIIKRGYTTKSLQAIWDSMSSIEENDELLRTKQDYFVGVDGEVANDVPLKFIKELKNKEDLSTDLVSSVIFFVDMALNYKNKMEIDSKLRILRYNMDSDIRDVYESRLKPEQEQYANKNERSVKMFDSMMDTSMYGNRFEKTTSGGPSKKTVVVHKTADMFQRLESSAMLGFNMFSMAVGFGDSVTRIFSESVAGKYMTVGDCVWAFGKCLYYTPACIKNMFNPLANNKMTALMQMNGISKGTFATYTKVDWGKGRKFLGNVLMGGWSMLDWMANALLMMAFYHNCRFFEGVIENGTQIIKPGFYTKYELQQAFINAGKTKAEANRIHHGWGDIFDSTEYKTLDKDGNVVKKKFRGRITLWDAYQFAPYYKDELGHIKKAHGRVVVLDEYAPFVTQRVKTNIATKTKKRGALYNGMNPDNDTPMWKRDILGRLAGALRSWISQQVQHLFAGGTDNIEVTFSKVQTPEVKGASTKMKTRYVKNKLTDELLHRRMSWDYETGTPQDQIAVGLWRSFKTMYKMSVQTLLHKPKTAKLSEVEKYAWKDAIIFLAMLSMMMVGWVFVHDDAREVKKPTNRIEAGPASMLNPVDYYDFIQNVYIPNLYWKLGVDNVYFRITESKVSNINPQQVLDIVNALTALKSGLDDQIGVIGLATDAINGENTDEVLKQGAYKFYTKGERLLYRAVGPAKNLHTFLTYYGATNNLRWYTNKFGKFYRAFGYDFKVLDALKPKQKQLDILRGDITRGDITRSNDILR